MDTLNRPCRNYVCGFMFNSTGALVRLIQKLKPDWQAGCYNGIGGKIKKGETPVEAMVREFHEEAGVRTVASDWYGFCDLRGINGDFKVYFFRTFASFGMFDSVRSMEEEQIHTYNVAMIPKACLDNLKWLIPLALAKSKTTAKVVDG